jgi:hypothetical protein
MALSICRRQNHEHRVSTVVLPDLNTSQVQTIVERARVDWVGPLELVALPLPERWLMPRLNTAWRNHGLQLIAGVSAAPSSHFVLHDADLFLLNPTLLKAHYEECRDRRLDCLGLSPAWDTWFAQRGRALAATWDLCARVDWVRSFPPHLHVGHDALVLGEVHNCDTTLHPQALTGADRIAISHREDEFVHFNYVISTYREFQRSVGPFMDDEFRVLLIRVFVELFGDDEENPGVPTAEELVKGLHGASARIIYPSPVEAHDEYAAFRTKLWKMVSGAWTEVAPRLAIVETFDIHYGFAGVTEQSWRETMALGESAGTECPPYGE